MTTAEVESALGYGISSSMIGDEPWQLKRVKEGNRWNYDPASLTAFYSGPYHTAKTSWSSTAVASNTLGDLFGNSYLADQRGSWAEGEDYFKVGGTMYYNPASLETHMESRDYLDVVSLYASHTPVGDVWGAVQPFGDVSADWIEDQIREGNLEGQYVEGRGWFLDTDELDPEGIAQMYDESKSKPSAQADDGLSLNDYRTSLANQYGSDQVISLSDAIESAESMGATWDQDEGKWMLDPDNPPDADLFFKPEKGEAADELTLDAYRADLIQQYGSGQIISENDAIGIMDDLGGVWDPDKNAYMFDPDSPPDPSLFFKPEEAVPDYQTFDQALTTEAATKAYALGTDTPITDLAYFDASGNIKGLLPGVDSATIRDYVPEEPEKEYRTFDELGTTKGAVRNLINEGQLEGYFEEGTLKGVTQADWDVYQTGLEDQATAAKQLQTDFLAQNPIGQFFGTGDVLITMDEIMGIGIPGIESEEDVVGLFGEPFDKSTGSYLQSGLTSAWSPATDGVPDTSVVDTTETIDIDRGGIGTGSGATEPIDGVPGGEVTGLTDVEAQTAAQLEASLNIDPSVLRQPDEVPAVEIDTSAPLIEITRGPMGTGQSTTIPIEGSPGGEVGLIDVTPDAPAHVVEVMPGVGEAEDDAMTVDFDITVMDEPVSEPPDIVVAPLTETDTPEVVRGGPGSGDGASFDIKILPTGEADVTKPVVSVDVTPVVSDTTSTFVTQTGQPEIGKPVSPPEAETDLNVRGSLDRIDTATYDYSQALMEVASGKLPLTDRVKEALQITEMPTYEQALDVRKQEMGIPVDAKPTPRQPVPDYTAQVYPGLAETTAKTEAFQETNRWVQTELTDKDIAKQATAAATTAASDKIIADRDLVPGRSATLDLSDMVLQGLTEAVAPGGVVDRYSGAAASGLADRQGRLDERRRRNVGNTEYLKQLSSPEYLSKYPGLR